MNSISRFTIILLIGLIIASCASVPTSDRLRIVTKESVVNGSVVPVSIHIRDALTGSEVLEIFANGELATKVSVAKGASITNVSIRVRMKKNGKIKAQIKSGQELRASADSVLVNVKSYSDKPKYLGAAGSKYRKKVKGSKVHTMFVNYMTPENYLEQVEMSTDAGNITFKNTIIMAAHPYLSFVLNGTPGVLHINTKLHKE